MPDKDRARSAGQSKVPPGLSSGGCAGHLARICAHRTIRAGNRDEHPSQLSRPGAVTRSCATGRQWSPSSSCHRFPTNRRAPNAPMSGYRREEVTLAPVRSARRPRDQERMCSQGFVLSRSLCAESPSDEIGPAMHAPIQTAPSGQKHPVPVSRQPHPCSIGRPRSCQCSGQGLHPVTGFLPVATIQLQSQRTLCPHELLPDQTAWP